jgi:hypothetical protein
MASALTQPKLAKLIGFNFVFSNRELTLADFQRTIAAR